MIYLQLFIEFFQTGLFSVGGGLATIPFLRNMSGRLGWFTLAELADMIAVGESTPGPIGVNTATYVGFKLGTQYYGLAGGILGGVVATLGLVTPSVIIIVIVASILDKFRKNKYVDTAFYGLRPASVGLIIAAGIGVTLIAFFDIGSIFDLTSGVPVYPSRIILGIVLFIMMKYVPKVKKLHPLFFIFIAAVAGIVLKM